PSRLSSVPCTVVATTASGSISYSCTMPLPPRSTLFPYTTLFRSGGMLSISADGNKAGTGILWALVPLNGDANQQRGVRAQLLALDRKSTRLNSSHQIISYAVFCLKKKSNQRPQRQIAPPRAQNQH